MADNANSDSGSFSRAFLPGLILGLVVGGLCGAVLPDLLGGRTPAGMGSHTGTGEVDTSERDRPSEPVVDDATNTDTAPDTGAATDAVDGAADAVRDAVDDAAGTAPSDGG